MLLTSHLLWQMTKDKLWKNFLVGLFRDTLGLLSGHIRQNPLLNWTTWSLGHVFRTDVYRKFVVDLLPAFWGFYHLEDTNSQKRHRFSCIRFDQSRSGRRTCTGAHHCWGHDFCGLDIRQIGYINTGKETLNPLSVESRHCSVHLKTANRLRNLDFRSG